MDNTQVIESLRQVQSSLLQLAQVEKSASSPEAMKVIAAGIVKQASFARHLDAYASLVGGSNG